MKKNQYLSVSSVILISFFCFIYSCKKAATTPPPVACVSAMTDTVVVGTQMTFTSCTQGATSYLWSFGDGSTATTATATHTYTTPGSYTVSFTPSNSAGAGTAKTFTVLITAGYWTFEGSTYEAVACSASGPSGMLANTLPSGTNVSTMQLLFFNNMLPTTNGTLTVCNGSSITGPNQVGISMTTANGVNTYISTGGNGTQKVLISVTGGKITASTTGVVMINQSAPFDSAAMTFNLIQQ